MRAGPECNDRHAPKGVTGIASRTGNWKMVGHGMPLKRLVHGINPRQISGPVRWSQGFGKDSAVSFCGEALPSNAKSMWVDSIIRFHECDNEIANDVKPFAKDVHTSKKWSAFLERLARAVL